MKVQVIDDEDHEEILERGCAIDVAKASGLVCLRLPADASGPEGRRRRTSRVWTVPATTRAVMQLADQLVTARVEKVTLESTSDYWRIWYYLLEGAGLNVQLVNSRDAKHAPGRPKTDKLDCVWQAKLTERGLLRPSFVPPAPIRELRDYTRLRTDLVRDRARHYQRLEKLLEDALIKVSSVASRMDAVSVRDMVEALIAGERDGFALAGLARGRMRSRHDDLVEALTGRFDDHHGELARILLDAIDALTAQIDQLTARIEQVMTSLPEGPATTDHPDGQDGGTGEQAVSLDGLPRLSPVQRLAEIPGIKERGAQIIIAEIGLDMTRFPTADHLASWAKLTPRTIQSGPVLRGGKTGKGNPYLKGVLGEAATGAAKTQTFLGERYRRLVKRRGKPKALVAVARSILVIVWHLLSDPDARYNDLGVDYFDQRNNTGKKLRNHIRQLEALGYTVTLTPAAA